MISMKTLFAIPAVPAIAAAAVLATASPAAAVPGEPASGGAFATSYALGQGPCVAIVDSSVNGNAYPNHAAFTVGATLIGIGDCSMPVTLNWRNLDTGETGSVERVAHGPGYWGTDGRSALFAPGIGRFNAAVTIGGAHVPEPGSIDFTVIEYQG